jgi:hypothetical protein
VISPSLVARVMAQIIFSLELLGESRRDRKSESGGATLSPDEK